MTPSAPCPIRGTRAVIVGDAADCQRDLSEAVVARGGEYFWVVKDNQPERKEAIAGAFEAPVPPRETARLEKVLATIGITGVT